MPMKTMVLPVRLTADELAARHEELARAVDARDIHVAAAKSAATRAKNEVEKLEADIQRLKRICLDHAEGRPVETREEKNHERLTIDLIRLDTYEVVQSRGMTEHERNGDLFEAEARRRAREEAGNAVVELVNLAKPDAPAAKDEPAAAAPEAKSTSAEAEDHQEAQDVVLEEKAAN